jgi:hypothetical protein
LTRVTVALLAFPFLAVAAPVPKPESDAVRFEKLLGKAVLPDKKGEFAVAGDTLTVKFPKGEYVGSEDHPLLSPHTAREVEGDFELTASVRITGPKEPPATGKQWDMGAGLVAWDDEAEKWPEVPWAIFAARRFDGDSRPNEDKQLWREKTVTQFRQHSYRPKAIAGTDPTTTRHLRLTRKGDMFTVSVSDDGTDWAEQQSRDVDAGKKLRVGVWAYKRVDGAGDVVFENVTLTTGK